MKKFRKESKKMDAKAAHSPQKRDEDLDAFEEMEKNFNRVVKELINDRSLDKFREEYEKLHDALVRSHEHNNVLIEKCRTLNQDILKHANKISTVLTMSQNDQRTIANLRTEFEKAWKMVEQSQIRETRSRDVIETLKVELTNISELATKSRELAIQNDSSKKQEKEEIEKLTREIEKNNMVNEKLTKELTETRDSTESILPMNKQMHSEFDEMSQERESIRVRRRANKQEMSDAYTGMSDTRADIAKSNQRIEELKQEKEDQKEVLRKLELELKKANQEAALIANETEDIHKRIHKKKLEKSIAIKNKQS